ncbi:MAG: hypothetical protein R2724_26390 [Bryobacterales bacterium]
MSVGCDNMSIGPVAENMDPLTEQFAREPLAMDPVTATEVGYHKHTVGGTAEGEGAARPSTSTKSSATIPRPESPSGSSSTRASRRV